MAPAPTDDIETRTPSSPSDQHRVDRGPLRIELGNARAIGRHDRAAEHQHECGHEQRDAEYQRDQAARGVAVEIEVRQHRQRDQRGRDAAARQPPDHAPVDAARVAVHQAAAGLGGGGIEQVGADGRRRMNAKHQDQDRRHQRAAADAGHAHEQANGEPRKGIKRIDQMHGKARRGRTGRIAIKSQSERTVMVTKCSITVMPDRPYSATFS